MPSLRLKCSRVIDSFVLGINLTLTTCTFFRISTYLPKWIYRALQIDRNRSVILTRITLAVNAQGLMLIEVVDLSSRTKSAPGLFFENEKLARVLRYVSIYISSSVPDQMHCRFSYRVSRQGCLHIPDPKFETNRDLRENSTTGYQRSGACSACTLPNQLEIVAQNKSRKKWKNFGKKFVKPNFFGAGAILSPKPKNIVDCFREKSWNWA